MTRIEALYSYQNHSWLRRVYGRLKPGEIALCVRFINENDALDKGEFEKRINRMFLDDRNKPKHWVEICELLTCANSQLKAS